MNQQMNEERTAKQMNEQTNKWMNNIHLIVFKACLKQEPQNAACVYMEGLCHAALGDFYQAVKASTKASILLFSKTKLILNIKLKVNAEIWCFGFVRNSIMIVWWLSISI